MTGSSRIFLSILLFLFTCPLVWAQNISVNLEPSFGIATDSFIFNITVKDNNISKLSPPSFKESKEFVITSSGTTTQTQIMNGTVSNQLSFNFELSGRAGLPPGDYHTPAGTIIVNGRPIEIPPQKITIVETPPEQRQKQGAIKINQFTDKEIAYVGEQITYTVQVISGQDFLGGNLQDIEVMGFWREKLGDQEKKVFQAGSKTITTFQEILIPNRSGNAVIPKRKLTAQMQGHTRRIGGLPSLFDNDPFFQGFSRPAPTLGGSTINREFSTKPVKIKVRPLPPTKLEGYIPVGQLNIRSSIDRKNVSKGESINLKIRTSGFANLRPMEIQKPEKIENSFKVYIDPAETNVNYEKARIRFTKIFNIALVPTHSGELTIPEFKINYFDPLAEEYKALSTQAEKITVEGNFDERTEIKEEPQNEAEQVEEDKVETSTLLSDNQIFSISNSLFLAVSLLLISILLSLISTFKRYKSSKDKSESALSITERELAVNIEYSIVLKNFLNKKLNKNFSPLTLKEIQRDYFDKLNDENLIKQSREILTQLENFLYNPNQESPQDFKNVFLEFIKALDGKL